MGTQTVRVDLAYPLNYYIATSKTVRLRACKHVRQTLCRQTLVIA